jgi:periplasmic copper chaperone A
MKKIILPLLLLALSLSGCGTGEKEIEIYNAWVRPTAAGANAAVYFEMRNNTAQDDELLSVTTNVTDIVEIHTSSMDNDVMQMSRLVSVPLPAAAELLFEPGGMHIMLIDLKQDLVLGEHMDIILQFNKHADIVIEVHIEETMPDTDHGHQ